MQIIWEFILYNNLFWDEEAWGFVFGNPMLETDIVVEI